MCDLGECLDNYVGKKKVELTYNWNDQKADVVNTLFSDWYRRMHDANNTQELEVVINEIFKWGGVGSYNLKKHYAKRLSEENFAFESTSATPLSSWSKVLAAYTFGLQNNDENKSFIYDSRVAIALNIIAPEYKWFLPEEYGHSMVFALIKSSRKKSESARDSYLRYCESLREQGGVDLERRLFMLGKMLDFKCDNWRKYIFVNPEFVNQ